MSQHMNIGNVYKLTHNNGTYFIGSREGPYRDELLKSNFSGRQTRYDIDLNDFTKTCLYEGLNYIKHRTTFIDKNDPFCLNVQKGDHFMDLYFLIPKRGRKGVPQSEAHKAKLSASRKGKKRPQSTKDKMSAKHASRTPEEKQAIATKIQETKLKNGSLNNKRKPTSRVLCPICGKNVTAASIARWHKHEQT